MWGIGDHSVAIGLPSGEVLEEFEMWRSLHLLQDFLGQRKMIAELK